MSTRMQVVLLRFLETGEIQRIGADRSHTRVNVRLVTATNRDLPKEIAAGNFREDLFFRLNVIRMHIPPLRERIEDVPAALRTLSRHLLRSASRRAAADPTRDVGRPDGVSMAGQHPRAAQRRRAHRVEVDRAGPPRHGSPRGAPARRPRASKQPPAKLRSPRRPSPRRSRS